MPGGTTRNWESYGPLIAGVSASQKAVLADPQTSGGLLVAVDESRASDFEKLLANHGKPAKPFGRLVEKQSALITVR
jgi:selenide,water dikinase